MLVVMVRVAVPPPQRAKQFLMLNVPWDTHPFSSSPEVDEKYLVDVETYAKVQGQPLLPSEVEEEMWQRLS